MERELGILAPLLEHGARSAVEAAPDANAIQPFRDLVDQTAREIPMDRARHLSDRAAVVKERRVADAGREVVAAGVAIQDRDVRMQNESPLDELGSIGPRPVPQLWKHGDEFGERPGRDGRREFVELAGHVRSDRVDPGLEGAGPLVRLGLPRNWSGGHA